jgi:AraC-like DNA-binding protein
MGMDVLSDVMRVVRLSGSVFFRAELSDPFSIESPSAETLIRHIPLRVECISLFHLITSGQCWFQPVGGEPLLLEEGSIIVFPHGNAHIMCSKVNLPPQPLLRLMSFEKVMEYSTIKYGGNGEATQFVCGYLLCDQRFNPLLGAIPEVIVLRPAGRAEPQPQQQASNAVLEIEPGGWLDLNRQQLLKEVFEGGTGSKATVSRLTELLYVEVLRRYMKELPGTNKGWLAGIRDPEVGRALRCIHEQPAAKWNVEELAAEVGVSRSAFAQRFTHLTGESPMRYLTRWRMQLAKSLLLNADLSIAMVAGRVGYDSGIAFSRAFSRHIGTPPATWRGQKLAGR